MGRCLALYDLSGIQKFIFQTNRLQEIVGASHIVSKALFANIPELLGEGMDDWKSRDFEDFYDIDDDDGKVVYIGGGNALVLFGDEKIAYELTRDLKERVFLQTGGALRVCSSVVEADGTRGLDELLGPRGHNTLRSLLDISKERMPAAFAARGLSINRLDNVTQEPCVYFEDEVEDDDRHMVHFMARSRAIKRKEYKTQQLLRTQQEDNVAKGFVSPLVKGLGVYDFQTNADNFFKEDDENAEMGNGKHFLAVVHIDGNTMGQRISNFLLSMHKDELDELDFAIQLSDMRDFSVYISSLYSKALKSMIDSIYGQMEGTIPFRPVVADGDDITFVCRASEAFDCVEAFVNALRNPIEEIEIPEHAPTPKELSVGAGIAFCHAGHPFSDAYDLAESLCKNAKQRALELSDDGVIRYGERWEGERLRPPISSVDFHVCSGELVGSVSDFRAHRMAIGLPRGGTSFLCMRPYFFNVDIPEGMPDFSFVSFRKRLARLQVNARKDPPWVSRGKLKALRDRYASGTDQACFFGASIYERALSVFGEGDEAAYAEEFKTPFVQCGNDQYARFFDAIDVLDLCDGEPYRGKGQQQ